MKNVFDAYVATLLVVAASSASMAFYGCYYISFYGLFYAASRGMSRGRESSATVIEISRRAGVYHACGALRDECEIGWAYDFGLLRRDALVLKMSD